MSIPVHTYVCVCVRMGVHVCACVPVSVCMCVHARVCVCVRASEQILNKVLVQNKYCKQQAQLRDERAGLEASRTDLWRSGAEGRT